MEVKLPEIQEAINELKNNSEAMEKEQVRAAVEQFDVMFAELELDQTLALPGTTLDFQANIVQIEKLMSSIPRIFEAVSQKEPLLRLLLQASETYRGMGEPQRTVEYCEQILVLTEDEKYSAIRAEAFRQLGNLQFYQRAWAQARAFYQQALDLFEAEGDLRGVARIYNRLGSIASEQGDYELAKSYYQQVIDRAKNIPEQDESYRRSLASAYRSLGILASKQNDWNQAIDYCEQSINIYDELDLPRESAGVYMNLAMAYVDCQEWEAAGACYAKATEMAEKSGNLFLISQIYINRAELLLHMANIDAARLYCDKALEIFQKTQNTNGVAEAYKLYGRIHRHRKDWDTATEYFTDSIQLYQSCQNPQGEAEGCYEFGLMYKDCQNLPQARYFLRRARNLYEQQGATDEINRVETALADLPA